MSDETEWESSVMHVQFSTTDGTFITGSHLAIDVPAQEAVVGEAFFDDDYHGTCRFGLSEIEDLRVDGDVEIWNAERDGE
ncbi:hypothetical protein [Halopiger xanaduensis]|uniref:Uncharacterized protein n=1 Tax=Halopiger xanaduensis (strain DSM 18323 / JCM 14033 / SH-6) TaxID=797210 RepID=F8DER7_HALXS|nr:hypothetical protein [Halopiger xanaduensis]AEH39507.1 hypothetical protein Halxa_0267 [Halopiger xanaduensis SH-6]